MTTTPATSPLLDLSGLPRFDAIQPAHVEPAVRSLLEALVNLLFYVFPHKSAFANPKTSAIS